uniref:UBC core domain-containing protein n=2 Tax=Glycine subgen. Soja TaxID=1462606 RepID=A0A0R0F7L9_SOYBN
MKEWKILEQSLPESIYVRVYERRIDLMRAVIVGTAGTPYHDGLFFFDIMFPSDYPKHPPMLHFHSFGYRINPNLYINGKVCLSLLNTWNGKGTEMWDPSKSTMLQVLVSIQGLVLNKNPYFNEPLRLFDSESKSRVYNENAFIITCYTSFLLLQRPLRNFEAFVSAHFCERAFPILSACSDYVNGRVEVGYYSSDLRSSSSTVRVSREFKEKMIQFYPKLFQAFRLKGASVGGLVEHLELEIEQSEKKSSGGGQRQQLKNKSRRIFKKVMEKIKQTLGWKKKSQIEGRDRSLQSS